MDPTLSVFTRAVARESAPASGSAAAVAVAMAAALAQKVAERSEGSAREFAAGMDLARRRALELAEADAAAVRRMLARGAPGAAAIDVPREIGELAAQVREVAVELEASGKPALLADAAGARHLAEAGGAMVRAILRSNA